SRRALDATAVLRRESARSVALCRGCALHLQRRGAGLFRPGHARDPDRSDAGVENGMISRCHACSFWGAHAPRVLATAPSPSRTLFFPEPGPCARQGRFGDGAETSTRGACAPRNGGVALI